MQLPDHSDVLAGAQRLQGVAHITPVLTSRTLDAETGAQVFIKCENLQRAGSFKFRGAFNALSQFDAQQCRAGVVAFSSGNHAQGIALAARLLGMPATIVHIDTPNTIADGAQTQHLGNCTFPIIRDKVNDILTVCDAQLVEAMRFFMQRMKLVVEPTGCLGLAALRQLGQQFKGRRVGVIVTGGNVDMRRYAELLSEAS